jgi:hypothetical protein
MGGLGDLTLAIITASSLRVLFEIAFRRTYRAVPIGYHLKGEGKE